MNISLSLVSHTNIGKTSLARTLLRRDVGQAIDQAHVTDTADAYELVSTDAGDALLLWDTPGMGDSARLLKRLSRSADASGWLLTQAWDRWIDRPFFSSQMAMRNVRDHSDVVLYLVNAAEGPASAGYVGLEMQILGWMGKPVLVLLNQTGPPREGDADARDEAAWREQLAPYPLVREILSLDAFSRCWIQEDLLFVAVRSALPAEQQPALDGIRAEWTRRNLAVFEDSMAALSRQLARTAVDHEPTAPRGWAQELRERLLGAAGDAPSPGVAAAMEALARRADAAARESTQELIRLHGLNGAAAAQLSARVATHFTLNEPLDPARAGLAGAAVAGALGGLAADLAAGGLTLGVGTLLGGVLGLFGASGAAKAYNVARGLKDGLVRWSPDFLTQRLESAVLRYLAVAHFGRGRGDWTAGEYPSHWPALVKRVTQQGDAWQDLWDRVQGSGGEAPAEDARVAMIRPVVREIVAQTLAELYPRAVGVLRAPPAAR